MTHYNFQSFMSTYLLKYAKYGKMAWTIELTTKRDKKCTDWKDPASHNHYTLLIYLIDTNDLFMKSDEMPGSNKNNWSSDQYGTFVATLKEV